MTDNFRLHGLAAYDASSIFLEMVLATGNAGLVERLRTVTDPDQAAGVAGALERMRGYARQRHDSGADAWVVQYIEDRDSADDLADECREIFGREPVFISEVGPVLGAHIGPGMLGVGSVPESALETGPPA